MIKLAKSHGDKVNFIMVNIEGNEENANKFGTKHDASSATKLLHVSQKDVPKEYGIKYIPHKVIIGKDGKVIKNYDNVNLSADVESL